MNQVDVLLTTRTGKEWVVEELDKILYGNIASDIVELKLHNLKAKIKPDLTPNEVLRKELGQ